jgi:amino acid adenylation domain-containing protein
MAADPESRYDAFSPMSPAERERLLVDWNKTDEDYPRTESIHGLFERRAEALPLKTALVSHNQKWTYRELNRRANDVACKLIELGVGPGVLVGICMERTANMVAGLLGILKAGAAYVPLDPAFPRERLAFMLNDANAQVLITENKSLLALPATEADVVCIDALDHQRLDGNGTLAQPGDLAYVIYTSGSTGKPKGVQVPHRAVVNLLTSAGKTIAFKPEDKLLSVTTLSFDIAALEMFLPLISGGQLILATQQTATDGTILAELIDSSQASVMQATPTTWRLLIESGWKGKKELRILCGGEALSRSLADALCARVGKVWNFYGPTETTIWSTAWKVIPDAPIAIGRPLANTQMYILDSQLQPVPVGVAGELHIGGHGLACGYLGRPELTNEKFIANPFRQDGESRLYKTGDWARYQPDGVVQCLGRIDQQVKIRGFRIELGEIETALRQHTAVADAVVTSREDAAGEKLLVGYLMTRNGPPTAGELRDFIRSKLPAYMVPTHFVMMKEFPLTPNGKIDARRLPAPEGTAPRARNYIAPRNDHERALVEVWQEVLTLRQVSIEDDFFELGADSLSATRAFARINRRFGTDLPLRAIFENPTVAALAEVVQKAGRSSASRPIDTRRRSRLVTAAG